MKKSTSKEGMYGRFRLQSATQSLIPPLLTLLMRWVFFFPISHLFSKEGENDDRQHSQLIVLI